ncbi:LOW QUALITY PROTEIN: calmodulin-like protein 6 [Sus scrofa]|uniref:LOW QUALITY PROTEIN: calmodulin-like protein 6 n=1 Tax=Sus scrofa TaxID=9823 RepID=UPI000A2AF2F1|nr:LOW QUALITY PROTEIN: calmodulin-like protein 6 [Sus scrofa]
MGGRRGGLDEPALEGACRVPAPCRALGAPPGAPCSVLSAGRRHGKAAPGAPQSPQGAGRGVEQELGLRLMAALEVAGQGWPGAGSPLGDAGALEARAAPHLGSLSTAALLLAWPHLGPLPCSRATTWAARSEACCGLGQGAHAPCPGASRLPWPEGRGAPGEPGPVSPQTERLTAEQIKDYRGVFEMFDEEGNGQVKTGELVWLMGLLGINPTKSELASMAKDVDRDSEAGRGSPGRGGGAVPPSPRPCCLLPAEKGFFSYDSFLALMGVSREKAQNQEHELRVAFRVFDKEGKGASCIDWDMLKSVLMNAGEPLKEVEAEQMTKEADKGGDGTINYEGE